jgi:hypothetical protein
VTEENPQEETDAVKRFTRFCAGVSRHLKEDAMQAAKSTRRAKCPHQALNRTNDMPPITEAAVNRGISPTISKESLGPETAP